MIDKSYLFLTFIVLSFFIIAEDDKNSLIEVYSKDIDVNSINIVLKDNIDIRNDNYHFWMSLNQYEKYNNTLNDLIIFPNYYFQIKKYNFNFTFFVFILCFCR